MTEKIKFNILKHAGEPTPYDAGSTIFKSGEPGDSMFVVTHGEVDIMVDGNVIDHLTDGEVFGEMSLIDKVPRSADAVASTDCEIVKIDETRFLYMTENTPMFALKLMRIITARLRERMADLKELRGE
jgi:CRP-like cAMP-binding protein